ncbi:MAG: 1-(5-phosphoribosyl)-5-[(5-phosphoribosylamino)methylideneamino]imidazole-4-carboxamide isomerase [Clostridia bacterium]|nr:1-(5-phosphoribosyl)-5-[(5-phosphoribosylamino)methylideneamino]imidazole-4-carboxamide isomerase [Clostridia bacterium]
MSFTIYPAVDIKDGKCVRLFQGDYNLESRYFENPLEAAEKWCQGGARWLHIVDLDGAKTGKPDNMDLIREILARFKINIQVGGGIRNLETVESYLKSGAARVIIGSQALKDIKFVEELLALYGAEKIVVSLDGRSNQVFSDGWLKDTGDNLFSMARKLTMAGVKRFIYTDIEKDGTLTGPNITQALNLAAFTNQEIIVAGGISDINDVLALARYYNLGIRGAVIGRALYTGDINLQSLISQLGSA